MVDWDAASISIPSLASQRAIEFKQGFLPGNVFAGFDAADGFQANAGAAGQFNLRAIRFLLQPPVDFAAMTNIYHQHNQFLFADLIEDAPITDPQTP